MGSNIATEVYTTEDIRLQDESEVELRPLNIAKLRKFRKIWSEHMAYVQKTLADAAESDEPYFDDSELTDRQFTVFVQLAALGLESQLKGEKTDKQFIAYLEEILDEQTCHKILNVTGGLELGNQNPAGTNNPAAVELGKN